MKLNFRKQVKELLPPHYSTIDDPVYYWHKIHETGDMSWLLKAKREITEAEKTILGLVFEKMYDEYIAVFGFSNEFESILKKRIEIIILKCRKLETGDMSMNTEIAIAEKELAEMKEAGGVVDFMPTIIAIEKSMGFSINTKEVSIRKFYSYQKELLKQKTNGGKR